MKLKYKCTVELEMPFPDKDERATNVAKEAIDQIIDAEIREVIWDGMCDVDCVLTVTRESMEYVEDEESATTTSCGCEED